MTIGDKIYQKIMMIAFQFEDLEMSYSIKVIEYVYYLKLEFQIKDQIDVVRREQEVTRTYFAALSNRSYCITNGQLNQIHQKKDVKNFKQTKIMKKLGTKSG